MKAVLLVIFVMLVSIHANGANVAPDDLRAAVLISDANEVTVRYIEALRTFGIQVEIIDINDDWGESQKRINDTSTHIIAIGKQAFTFYLSRQLDLPTLIVYVKRSTFHHVIESFNHLKLVNNYKDNTSNISVIYEEPNPALQLQLIKKYYPNKAAALMYSELNRYIVDELKEQADAIDIKLALLEVPEGANINQALNTLPREHALLAIPDRRIYNRMTIKNIYLSTYRTQTPIFGFSFNTVRAGSVASYYSTEENFAQQSFEWLSISVKTVYIGYPKYYALEVNEAVARSLNLNIDQEEAVK